MADSVRKQIIARLLEILDPLTQEQDVDTIKRVRDLAVKEDARKAIHLVVGDETRIDTHAGMAGYEMTFPVNLKLILKAGDDLYSKMEDFATQVQSKLEASHQVADANGNALATSITYEGDLDLTNETLKGVGITVLAYTINYRRKFADPTTSF